MNQARIQVRAAAVMVNGVNRVNRVRAVVMAAVEATMARKTTKIMAGAVEVMEALA